MTRVCLSEDDVTGLFDDGLSAQRRKELDEHIVNCAECRELVAAYAASMRSPPQSTTDHGANGPERRGKWLNQGTKLGRYVVLEQVGQGAMGVVYAAYDPQLKRRIALKLIRLDAGGANAAGEASATKKYRDRLLREAQALAQLKHPNVITVLDVELFGDEIAVVMDLVEGTTLTQWLKEGKRAWRQVVDVLIEAGKGLAAAHETGLIHRDFKPDNVLIGQDGRVVVTDFGLVRWEDERNDQSGKGQQEWEAKDGRAKTEEAETLTETGVVMGTPAYMAPELFRGEAASVKSDQYSFCVTVWEGLYGRRPHEARTLLQLKHQVLQGHVGSVGRSGGVPAWIKGHLNRGLSTDPSARYESMAKLLQALRTDPWRRRKRWAMVVAGVLASATMLMGYEMAIRQRTEMCRGAERHLVGVWDDASRMALRKAILATSAPGAEFTASRVEEELNLYTAGWVKMHTESCEATRLHGEQSDEVLGMRTLCLTRRLESVQALVNVLQKADVGVVNRAIGAVGNLAPLAECADTRAL